MPRREAISRASDGEEARAWLSIRAAASAEVGDLCFVTGFVEAGGEVGSDGVVVTTVGCSTTDSAVSGMFWYLIKRASFWCCSSSCLRIRKAFGYGQKPRREIDMIKTHFMIASTLCCAREVACSILVLLSCRRPSHMLCLLRCLSRVCVRLYRPSATGTSYLGTYYPPLSAVRLRPSSLGRV